MSEVKLSQRDDIIRHLMTEGSITAWEAIKEYGSTRLSAIVYELRKKGWHIESEMVTSKNRYGKPFNSRVIVSNQSRRKQHRRNQKRIVYWHNCVLNVCCVGSKGANNALDIDCFGVIIANGCILWLWNNPRP